MNKDTRITLGLGLVYFLNGFIHLFGDATTFAPMVFIDSFVLALLSLVFVVMPPFGKKNLFFLLFALHFTLQGYLNTRGAQWVHVDVANQVLLLALCLVLYIYPVWRLPAYRWMFGVPAGLFVVTVILRLMQVPPLIITGTAVLSGLWQVYLLSRPDITQQLNALIKRFYLLMVMTIFLDVLYQVFFYLNFSQQAL